MILYWGLVSAVLKSTTEARDGRELHAFQSTDLWTAGLITDSCGDYEIDEETLEPEVPCQRRAAFQTGSRAGRKQT
jgi:hypothetical protein